MEKEIVKASTTEVAQQETNMAYGFEDTKASDILIPRIKVVQALSPERIDKEAEEGEIINSLTKERVAGKRFIIVKQYYSNICWNPDRGDDVRMFCRSLDGRIGQADSGSLSCADCKKNMFDNTKQGKEAQPACTSYLNFLGFFSDDCMPVVLSFARTNYNEGKKLLSIARSMRCSIWNYAYAIDSKQLEKNRNKWFTIVPRMIGPATPEEQAVAFEIYKQYEKSIVNAEYEDAGAGMSESAPDETTAQEI